ncbi:hypothetical protein [Aquabacter spiritensis]|uniref:hypothetical protein n=1 Tax=Aquabacter spiritensis TaxID=933073 RepID=UPI00105244CA|nr:hypothetical protein [Aquabacter spiritensis]
MRAEGGRPSDGGPGVQSEWFYTGDGAVVVRPWADYPVPAFADDAGEEPEVAGARPVGPDGMTSRLGFAIGNEATDHVMEKKAYFYLSHSKLRRTYGPEPVLGRLAARVEGTTRIRRGGAVIWEKPFLGVEESATLNHANVFIILCCIKLNLNYQSF